MSVNLKQLIKALALTVMYTIMTTASQASTTDLNQRFECEACHGVNGVSQNTDIPSIAGIPEFNLLDQMMRYNEGRPAATVNHLYGDTGKSGDMATVVKALSEQDIAALAVHYSQMEFIRAKQAFDPDLAAKGKVIHDKSCDRCHAQGGGDPYDEASILAGQQKGYLLTTLKQFQRGERSVDKKMDQAIRNLNDEELVALSEYYASFQ
ncbi:cytochrome c-553 [Vibrio sp. CAU 1672]|uniref:c-type cytochrome n=1 Tax=Vibrio sp. CAU 1672 TaxID=3032594 RepID=UPI0023DB52F5|nr:cytochrome c-553 [Vibrio sp. CAU 1672]MDF2152403.1 cytochrome c-553 [Vibrio sp. CAU 1672]